MNSMAKRNFFVLFLDRLSDIENGVRRYPAEHFSGFECSIFMMIQILKIAH